ncbi:MAG TPA: UDPGP type 1 family protein, partial [Planctomycetota bacterium]|nr:UDPGP type 1 family protein [Planctomycetota bacterium]
MDKLRDRLARVGQAQVLRFWDVLDGASRDRLARQVDALDLDLVDRLVRTRVLAETPDETFDFEPVDVMPLARTDDDFAALERARRRGEELLAEGRAACVVVAGGQGTRLGYDAPKGTFPIAPVSGKSLFELHVERIRALARRLDTRIPLFVMASETNAAATRAFFREHDNFDLADDDLILFVQGMMPAADFDGKLVLDRPDHLFASPDGHGGVMPALVRSGAVDAMRRRGVTDIYHFQVDNVLAKPADPVFLGFHRETSAAMSSKVTDKRDPVEKVGVTVKRADGRTACVEYIDLTDEEAARRHPDGSLVFRAANLCIYWYTVDFAESVGVEAKLPFHLARKKVPCVDDAGRTVEPDAPNAIKFETFVFDALPLAARTFVMELDRAEEFAPVKNATGEDSVDSARRAMTERAARWLESAGV